MKQEINISVVNQLSSVEISQLKNLLTQLITKQQLDTQDIERCLQDSHSFQVIAKSHSKIVGAATLLKLVTPHGINGYVHDVVVDQSMRGSGIGKKIMQVIDSLAVTENMKELNLTTSSRRPNAQRLYVSSGYHLKDTGFYTKDII